MFGDMLSMIFSLTPHVLGLLYIAIHLTSTVNHSQTNYEHTSNIDGMTVPALIADCARLYLYEGKLFCTENLGRNLHKTNCTLHVVDKPNSTPPALALEVRIFVYAIRFSSLLVLPAIG